ncbi:MULTISPECIES: hypothetical protein [unclassified Methylobacterium]|uniref:DUF6894 family protein n=1 Tax=unclassified Methylobacterium TaxID=2615210 RepID=UPI0016503124
MAAWPAHYGRDDEGTALEDFPAVRQHVLRLLPDIARDEVPDDGDRCAFSVVVTDEDGKPIYTATLNWTGLWLLRRSGPRSRALAGADPVSASGAPSPCAKIAFTGSS